MSRVAGDFLGETLAGDGAISDAPELTDDVEPGLSDLLRGEPSAAVLRGAGRDRGSGGDFRSTCGYRHRRHQSFFPLRNRNREWCQKAGRGWWNRRRRARLAGQCRQREKQRQNLMAGNAITPRYPLPPETTWQHPCWRLSQSMGRYDGTAMWNFGELSAAMRPARTLKFADGAALRDRRTQVGLTFPGNTVRLAWSADLKIVLRP
jgi:hypothetical protein